MVAIIDYGAGNLRSVQKAFEYIGHSAEVTSDPSAILAADHVILPGVGAFGDCMTSLKQHQLDGCIYEIVEKGTPFLGICLGLQMLFESSEENPDIHGLGILKGKNVRIPHHGDLKIPHMGWNSLELTKESPLLKDLPENPFVYFVHSYYMQPDEPEIIAATTTYGAELPIALSKDHIYATQFHPEKSGETGLQILKNFASL